MREPPPPPDEDQEEEGSKYPIEPKIGLFALAFLVLNVGTVLLVVNSDPPSTDPWDSLKWRGDLSFKRNEFEHCFVDDISDVSHVVVCWSVEGEEIRFGVGGKCSHQSTSADENDDENDDDDQDPDFLAIGISANGGMYGADIVSFSKKLGIQDRFSSSFSVPLVDDIQNVEMEKNLFQNGVLSFVFKRNLLACEEEKADPVTGRGSDLDILDDGQLTNVIWAIGKVNDNDLGYHGMMRGSMQLDLFSKDKTPGHQIHGEKVPSSEVEGDKKVLMNDGNGDPLELENYVNGTDTYLCLAHRLPKVKSKRHIIEIDAIVESSEYVHHMLLYMCSGEPPEGSSKPHSCDMSGCSMLITGWAVGGYARYRYPDGVGYPFGENGEEQYVVLQTHYNTPPALSLRGISDSSGFRLRYAPPRSVDVGMLFFGWRTDSHFLIPQGERIGSDNATFESYLPPECLSVMKENSIQNITIFQGGLHMHQYGRKSFLQHFRRGEELPLVSYSDFYDFNYQRYQESNRVILPDDTLKLTCMYDTTTAPANVTGGEGTNDEMCFYFFSYYPRVEKFGKSAITVSANEQGQMMHCGGLDAVQIDFSDYQNIIPHPEPTRVECPSS